MQDHLGNIASEKRTTHREFPWGEEMIEEVIDPNASALTTTYEYHENPELAGSYGKIQSVIYPDTSWVVFKYDEKGRIITNG